ncbi:uncharacterized protein AFUA_6G10190 [Aspergillus fumigatus Af293]|uniref:Uncharacterized protein n=2 Tax=Aspergillus fumigatus TaxID=746128 RepID=Q4WME4_ASPFU|nr:hypothetical protein AFUA_6G10190 [Aspergillus fumigatus Af293]EAL88870.1 hypothetical protein AFUA_6G10190 [Aspergillus fumigatus Af293]EDP49595.1 hypothetical protein AFUB_076250 [Aspergillus fumigatus A1163]
MITPIPISLITIHGWVTQQRALSSSCLALVQSQPMSSTNRSLKSAGTSKSSCYQSSAAVKRAGSQVKFVDYDSWEGHFNGRFCDNGVDESTDKSNTRTGLMFYELNTWDLLGGSPWKRSDNQPFEGTFEGTVNKFAQITRLIDPDAKFTEQAFISDAGTASVASFNRTSRWC